MIHIDCPWCDAPVEVNGRETTIRCDGCSVEVELAADEVVHEVSRAA